MNLPSCRLIFGKKKRFLQHQWLSLTFRNPRITGKTAATENRRTSGYVHQRWKKLVNLRLKTESSTGTNTNSGVPTSFPIFFLCKIVHQLLAWPKPGKPASVLRCTICTPSGHVLQPCAPFILISRSRGLISSTRNKSVFPAFFGASAVFAGSLHLFWFCVLFSCFAPGLATTWDCLEGFFILSVVFSTFLNGTTEHFAVKPVVQTLSQNIVSFQQKRTQKRKKIRDF